MTNKKQLHIPKEKVRAVSELVNLIKSKKTVLIVSIKGIPSSQYQEIVKKLRGKAIVKVPKKSIIFRALDSSGIETIKKLKEKIKENVAVLFSDNDAFELSAELISKKTPIRAKAGQEAPEDIKVEAGPTDLVPGPAITELGAMGIQIQIEKGKIHIKESKVIVKAGEKISSTAAGIMSKLDIKPFSIGFVPLGAFDNETKTFYAKIEIDTEKTLEDLRYVFRKTLPFAIEIGYVSNDTIKFLIGKAARHEKALENLISSQDKTEDKKDSEEKSGEGSESERENSKQQNKAESEEPKQEQNDKSEENKSENQIQTSEQNSGGEKK